MASGHCDFCNCWHSGSCCHPGRAAMAVVEAEREALRAACAAKDAALRAAVTLVRDRVPSGPDLHNACAALEAALSTDAGKGWIDASVAVEAEAFGNSERALVECYVPAGWAGCTVLVIKKEGT